MPTAREIQSHLPQQSQGALPVGREGLPPTAGVPPLCGIPATLLEFLKALEREPPREKPTISLLINCGFLEPEQNDTAVEILRLFCEQAGYPFGSVLKVASGEAILSTPFRFLVQRKVKRFARAVALGERLTLQVTMPLPKGVFLRASRSFWTQYGAKNGITPEQMASLEIEDGKLP